MIKLCWTLGSMPELAHLEPGDRRDLIHRCAGRLGTLWIILRSAFLGAIVALVLLTIVHLMGFNDEVADLVALGSFPFLTLAMYQFHLLRIRAAMRYHLKRAFRGEKLPVCLNCGYNLEGSPSDRCPECGAPVRVRG